MTISYRTGREMARSLVTYISDAHEVRRRILEEFDTAPSVRSIASLRGAYVQAKKRAEFGPIAKHNGRTKPMGQVPLSDVQERHAMTKFSHELLKALWRKHARICLIAENDPKRAKHVKRP